MTQYYSRIDTEFNGDVYSIPFSYINENEINVYINDELWEDWEFLNASQIKLLELPSDLPANSIITIQRNTNIEEKVVDFTNNTMLSESALDLSNDQFLYAIQEVYDDVSKFKIDVQEDVDKKVEAVSEAVSKINALEEAVVTATDAAQVASEQAEIAVETSTEAKELLNSSLEEIQEESIQAIEEIYKAGQSIVDTGIHTRATIDLDNITDKAKQDIQKQAKLANVPFCVNSGNVDENGNADLLYLPESGFTEVYWQNPTVTSLTDYGVLSGEGWSNILQAFDGSTALQRISIHSTTVDWRFPTDKRIFLNKLRIFWGGQGSVSGGAHSAYLELYKDGVALTRITITPAWSGWQDITFDKTECDRVYLYIDGYNLSDVPTRIGEVEFVGTEIIPISTSTQAFFKVGGNYPKLVATNTEETFEKNYLQPVNIEDIALHYKARYILIGALTDNDGLIGGFTTTSYAQIPMTVPFSIADNFEVVTKFTYKEATGSEQYILTEHNTSYFSGFGITTDGYINLFLGNSTHTTKFIEATSTYIPIDGHSYNLKFTFDGTTYRVFVKEENDTEFEEIITEESTERLADFIWNIGCSGCNGYYNPFAGTIDLKETHIKINGQIIWDNIGGAYNVFINDTPQPYALANNIYRQKTEPSQKFVQPILIENGVMGGDNFAVSSNVAQLSTNNVWKVFDGAITNTVDSFFHSVSGTKTGYIDIYNPIALNITNFKIYNQNAANRASSAGIIYGSNDGAEWTQVTTYTNSVQTASSSWNIDLSSNDNYYKYYRIESTAGGSDSYWVIAEIQITATEEIPPVDTVWLDTSVQPYKAYKFNGTEWEDFKDIPVGSITVENGVISGTETFDYNLTFKKVTSNMPSNKYIDLTLGASGSTYTAPANGYFYLNKIAGSDWYYIRMRNTISDVDLFVDSYRTSPLTSVIPAKKGERVRVEYNATGTTNDFRFIYAEGEV